MEQRPQILRRHIQFSGDLIQHDPRLIELMDHTLHSLYCQMGGIRILCAGKFFQYERRSVCQFLPQFRIHDPAQQFLLVDLADLNLPHFFRYGDDIPQKTNIAFLDLFGRIDLSVAK